MNKMVRNSTFLAENFELLASMMLRMNQKELIVIILKKMSIQ